MIFPSFKHLLYLTDGNIIVVEGQGMPVYESKSDKVSNLYLSIKVNTPELSNETKNKYGRRRQELHTENLLQKRIPIHMISIEVIRIQLLKKFISKLKNNKRNMKKKIS